MAGRSPTRVRDSESVSPRFEACKTGNVEVVRQLASPENVNSRDLTGRKSTPLHFAAGKQRHECVSDPPRRLRSGPVLRIPRSNSGFNFLVGNVQHTWPLIIDFHVCFVSATVWARGTVHSPYKHATVCQSCSTDRRSCSDVSRLTLIFFTGPAALL